MYKLNQLGIDELQNALDTHGRAKPYLSWQTFAEDLEDDANTNGLDDDRHAQVAVDGAYTLDGMPIILRGFERKYFDAV
jgi:hypothetical protein